MANTTITIIKWLFLGAGLLLLGLSTQAHGTGALVVGFMGLVFSSIGGGLIGYAAWRAKLDTALREHGHRIEAELQQVELNTSLEVNGVSPFRIVAQWHDAQRNEVFIFKSANLWFDPSEFVAGKKVPVYLDVNNPSKYLVDLSLLPTVHGA